MLCTCIFHHVQLLSARKGVHVLATPTHQEAAAGAGNPADDDHDDQAGSGNGIGHSTEPAASTCWISR